MRELEPYENTLTIEKLRREVRDQWEQKRALNDALIALPEVLPIKAMRAIQHAAMNSGSLTDFGLRKELQQKHGLDAIPPVCEFECCAAFWYHIRNGLLAAKNEKALADEYTRD